MAERRLQPGIPVSKRIFDLALTVPGLVLISPVLGILALLVRVTHGPPVLFQQKRPGYLGRPFHLNKFRTMSDTRDGQGNLLPDPERITPLGRFLRSTSLDELPELFNVLRGEMSLVGPRPLIQVEADLVDRHYEARFDVRPGITGPWQVFGRSDIPFDDMIKLDYTYVTNWSVGYDIKLMARTVSPLFAARGAY
jgi:sugar transferase EpsL